MLIIKSWLSECLLSASHYVWCHPWGWPSRPHVQLRKLRLRRVKTIHKYKKSSRSQMYTYCVTTTLRVALRDGSKRYWCPHFPGDDTEVQGGSDLQIMQGDILDRLQHANPAFSLWHSTSWYTQCTNRMSKAKWCYTSLIPGDETVVTRE